jgi:hypothetical protein
LSFHDEAIAEIGESQFGNTDEIARSSRAMTVFEAFQLESWDTILISAK